jgi:hypothetical protein
MFNVFNVVNIALQEQMGWEKRSLNNTDAGQVVGRGIELQRKRYETQLSVIGVEIEEALATKDDLLRDALLEQQIRLRLQIEESYDAQETMIVKMETLLQEQNTKLAEAIKNERQHLQQQYRQSEEEYPDRHADQSASGVGGIMTRDCRIM